MSWEALCGRADTGESFDFVFFSSPTSKVAARRLTDDDGLLVAAAADVSCLALSAPVSLVVDRVFYRTAAHFIAAEKARLFGDEASRKTILSSETPPQVQAVGQRLTGFDAATWQRECLAILVRGSTEKFRQHPVHRDVLEGTGDRILVDATRTDTLCGIGLAPNNPEARDPRTWRGRNLLGFALMEARAVLRREPRQP